MRADDFLAPGVSLRELETGLGSALAPMTEARPDDRIAASYDRVIGSRLYQLSLAELLDVGRGATGRAFEGCKCGNMASVWSVGERGAGAV